MAETERVGPNLAAEREARFQRWTEHVEMIKQHVWELHHHRAIWREMREVLIAASHQDTVFLDHYARLYAERQLIAVRRLVDLDTRTVSLSRLLTELSEHPASMTRQRHVRLWNTPPVGTRDHWPLEQANETFDRFADADGDNVNPDLVRQDLEAWRGTCQKIKTIVDKRIAHMDAAADAKIPEVTYNEIDEAIDTVGKLIGKYTLLFTAASIARMEPVIQGDWKGPFRAPLFPAHARQHWVD